MAIGRPDFNLGSTPTNPITQLGGSILAYGDKLRSRRLEDEKLKYQKEKDARILQMQEDKAAMEAEKHQMLKDENSRKLDAQRATNAGISAILQPKVAAQEYVSPETGKRLLEQYESGGLTDEQYAQMISTPTAVQSTKNFLLGDMRADQGKLLEVEQKRYNQAVNTPGTDEYKANQQGILDAYRDKLEIEQEFKEPKDGNDLVAWANRVQELGGDVNRYDSADTLKEKAKELTKAKKEVRKETKEKEKSQNKILKEANNPRKYLKTYGGFDMDREASSKVASFLDSQNANTLEEKKALLDKIILNTEDSLLPGIWDTDLEDTLDKLGKTTKY